MLSNVLVSVMFAGGVSGWCYYQILRRTGGQNSSGVFALVGLIALLSFMVFMVILNMLGR